MFRNILFVVFFACVLWELLTPSMVVDDKEHFRSSKVNIPARIGWMGSLIAFVFTM